MVDFARLSAPFDPREILWRVGSTNKKAEERRTGNRDARATKGQALAYIDARVVMDRLDAVCGPAGWQSKYSHANGKTVCDIGIKCADEWIWKADGAGDSDIEAEKGALSDAFKRAAVRWGIGRYLYEVDSPWVALDDWGKITTDGYKTLDGVMRRHTQAILNPAPAAARAATASIDAVKDEIAQQQNAGTQPITEAKSPGRVAAEKFYAAVMDQFGWLNGTTLGEWYSAPCTPQGRKSNREKIEELREKHPDLADKIDAAAEEVRLARAA